MSGHALLQKRAIAQSIADLEAIGRGALSQVDRKYGHDADSREATERILQFHNGQHSRMVGDAAAKMCAKLELPVLYQHLGRTVGYAHDIVQLKGAGINEIKSAAWLENALAGFSGALKTAAAKAIIGTMPTFKNGLLTGQRATELHYSSPLKNSL